MRARALPVLIAGLLAFAATAALTAAGAFERTEQRSIDVRFSLRGDQPVSDVSVVAIDDDTFVELDKPTWPFRRSLHARMVDALRTAGVRQIVYDVQFTEPSGRPGEDFALYEAVGRAPGTILATGESDSRGRTAVLGGDAKLAQIDAIAAAANLPTDAGGVIRRYERADRRLPALATRVASQLGLPAPVFGDDDRALIDFRGPAGTVPTMSFSDVLYGRVDPDLLRGKVVVVGATAPVLQDLHSTAAGGGLMPGPEIQANAIWTAMHGNPLREAPGWIGVVALIVCGIAGPLCVFLLGPLRGAAAAVGLAAIYAVGAQTAFSDGTVVPVAAPLVALAAGALTAQLAAAAKEITLRRQFAWRNTVLEASVRERTHQLEATQLEMIERLARAAELRDDDTGQHVDRMSHLCELVGLELGMSADEASLLRRAAVLHDIGKLGLPDGILRKPGRLTQEEIWVMRGHTTEGGSLLAGSPSPILQLAETIAHTHHERWDGTGYPGGIAGDAIPLEGRIAAVCDVFDALVSKRPYKEAWKVADATKEIADQRGRHFDPEVADALLRVVDRQAGAPDWVAGIASGDVEAEGRTEVATGRDVPQALASP